MWPRIFRRVRDQELHDELQSHLEMEIAHLVDRGVTRREAEARARQAFGNRTLVYEVTRQNWGLAWLERFFQDLRYAARTLRQTPAFTIAAVLSLALGIGASTAVFSIADTVFLRPLPYSHAEKLAWVAARLTRSKNDFLLSPGYLPLRRENRVFEQLAATPLVYSAMILNTPEPLEVAARPVSYNFLATLGVSPALGRTFTPEEELPNAPASVILTDRFWRAHYRGHPNVIGQAIVLDGNPYRIVGLLPASFLFPLEGACDILVPLTISPLGAPGYRPLRMWAAIGRLKPNVTFKQAYSDIAILFAAIKAHEPRMWKPFSGPVVESLQQHRIGNARLLLTILMSAVVCLLLIACANVANLLLARWSSRSRELAVRTAIGAGRSRLIRQLLTEAALLTLLGCAFGIALVAVAIRAFVHFAANEIPRLNEVAVDTRVLVIALALSLLTTLLFGALPAIRAGRININSALQAGRSGITGGDSVLRRALVSTEIALSVILLSSAALLFQTLWHLENDHLGFRPEHTVSVLITVKGSSFQKGNHVALADELLAYARRIPGTEAAALTICEPPVGIDEFVTFSRLDRPRSATFSGDIAGCGAGVDYFKALGTPLLKGRAFSEDDFRHPNTLAVINEAAARAYFPGEDPLGKQINGGHQGEWLTVIGIAADAKNQGLNHPVLPEMFVNDLALNSRQQITILLRTANDVKAVAEDMRSKLRSLDPRLLPDFATLNEGIHRLTAGTRFNTILLSSFAGIAFLMAIIGVYGVLAFAVTQRTREIGIRIALGARPQRVLRLVLREGAGLITAGVLIGLCGSLALTRYLTSLLYNVRSNDPRTYAAVAVGLTIAGLTASLLPARRAASVDPASTLRQD
jgi:predicted permease